MLDWKAAAVPFPYERLPLLVQIWSTLLFLLLSLSLFEFPHVFHSNEFYELYVLDILILLYSFSACELIRTNPMYISIHVLCALTIKHSYKSAQ